MKKQFLEKINQPTLRYIWGHFFQKSSIRNGKHYTSQQQKWRVFSEQTADAKPIKSEMEGPN
jgi:hypothetical protein